ncbi:MAG: hypothetical protein BZ138_05495 [Methanosphaera sp. rholeuAM270]|nr:MAG: hypothetical protein BZ138_05495 [Methanosphaera sp. rholeuAM270]
MKRCQNCGYENEDRAKFCLSCGEKLQNENPGNSGLDFNPDKRNTQQQTHTQQTQQPNNTRPDYNNTGYQQPKASIKQKNALLAAILDVIGGLILYLLSGIGQLYLGLYKRGIVLGIIGLVITAINMVIIVYIDNIFGTLLTLILGIALVLYSAYDAYSCANAINEGRSIPLLFGKFDLE